MKILIICGSRRKDSLTRKLTDIAFEYAKGKYGDVEYIDLGKKTLIPSEDLRKNIAMKR